MRIALSGEGLVIGAEVLVDVEAVDVRLSVVGESMAITLSWARFPTLWQLVKSIAINTHNLPGSTCYA